MMKLTTLVLLIAASVHAQEPTAIVDVAVVPLDRPGVVERQTVIIAQGRIQRIAPLQSARIPPNARRIDGRGKFLMPGLGYACSLRPGGAATIAGRGGKQRPWSAGDSRFRIGGS